MAKSDNLRKAKENKNDEFYTRLEDIEAEISQHKDYVKQFEGKTVLCNCDDPEWSNFFQFFKLHFKQLKLKKLITTHYNKDASPSYKLEWEGEMLNDDMVNLVKTPLTGNGDFRSDECIAILQEADIVVTNPPFSLFREYIAQLVAYDKKFIVISNMNAIAYKEFFQLLQNNAVYAGYGFNLSLVYKTPYPNTLEANRKFVRSKGFNPDDGYIKVPAICWFTNFDLDKAHEPLILTKNYKGNEDKYPTYENFDAIECSKIKDIPKDFNGTIGVPITFIENYCVDQFEIIGLSGNGDIGKAIGIRMPSAEHKKLNKALRQGACYIVDENGMPKKLYNRILINRKQEVAE